MSIAEFYVDNGIDPEWDAPNGMENFLRVHASSSGSGDNRKRGRDEEDLIQPGNVASNAAAADRPAKRVKRSKELATFNVPFPCAFERKGGCRFRSTCSYHHGTAVPCLCDSSTCPRGHAHRRAPRQCDHGNTDECRWNGLKECSFHHGVAETCSCDSAGCSRAHLMRVRRNAEARLERSKEMARNRPDFADRNARRLFLGIPRGRTCTEADVQAKFSQWVRTAALVMVENDPILAVQLDPEQHFAFIEFREAEVATASLSFLNGLKLIGWGEVRLEWPKVYDPSLAPPSDPNAVVTLDVSRLDHLKSDQSINKTKKKTKKAKSSSADDTVSHYRTWKKEQKALRTGETGQQLRQRYLELFPHRK